MPSISLSNPRYPKANTSKNGKLSEKHLKAGDLNGKKPFWFEDLKLTIYAKSKVKAEEGARLLRNNN